LKTLNLCRDPWIPVAGESERKSLLQIFTNRTYRRLSGNPVDKIVILRLLLSIVHAANRIPDTAMWRALTVEQMAENSVRYLEQHQEQFDLGGTHPFLQFPQLAAMGGKTASLGAMMVNIADGNKVVLSGWNQYRGISDAEKAVLLLRSACYACGGKKYDKTLILSSEVEKTPSGPGGTLLGFLGFLHAFLLGDTLLATLRFNLLTEQDIQSLHAYPAGMGTPFWEKMPQGENDDRAREYRQSYLGELFPIDKFLLLQGDGMLRTVGIRYPGHKDGLMDPSLTIFNDGKNIKAVWSRTDEHPWRELTSLLAFLRMDGTRQPFFLSMGLEKMRMSPPEHISIWTGGMAVKSNSGEQYLSGMNDYVESEFSFDPAYLGTQPYARFARMMQNLELQAKQLYACIKGYYAKMNSDAGADNAAQAVSRWWELLETRAQKMLNLAFSGAEEDELSQEEAHCFGILCRLYDESCPHETPRQMTAYVESNPAFQNKPSKKEVQ